MKLIHHTLTKNTWLLVTLLASLLFTISANAQAWYQVEIIIYEPHAKLIQTPHLIPTRYKTLDHKNAIELQPALPEEQNLALSAYRFLDPKDEQLSDELFALKRSHRYTILLHAAWRQPAHGRRHAKTILLKGGSAYTKEGREITAEQANAMLADNPDEDITWQIMGTLKLYGERYITLETDMLFYTKPHFNPAQLFSRTTDTDYINKGLMTFRFKQKRQMKFNELNYIDNPLFGILIKVTPYTP